MASAYANEIARVAEKEYDDFHFDSEDDPPLTARIKDYWAGAGFPFPGVGTPWSAVFISFCAKTAGATAAEFLFNPQRSQFIQKFLQNAKAGTGVFRAFPIATYAPQVGDIIQNNRGNNFDYAHAEANSSYPSHTAIVIETGTDAEGPYAMTVGGNESDSVRKKLVRLTGSGHVKQRPTNTYICVVQNLK
jgi:hypothetical protein